MDNVSNKSSESSGLKAVLDKALESYDKLPMLEVVFDRFARLLTTSLRNLTSENVDIKTLSYTSQRFGSYYDTVKPPSSIVVFKVVEWDNVGLMVVDTNLVFALVDLLFGGKKNNMPVRVEDRPHTYIEQALIRQISEVVLSELSAAFDPVSPATCSFERLELNPSFAAICRPGDAVIVLKMQVELDDRKGAIDLVLPYGTIEPIKTLLQQVFIGEKYGNDAEWEELMLQRIYTIDIPIEVVISGTKSTISQLANMKIGDTIIMEHNVNDEIALSCNRQEIFKGNLGKVKNNVAISISKTTLIEG